MRLALPWVLSLAILGWLFLTVDVDAVWAAIEGADMAAMAAWLFGFSTLVFLADSACLTLLFTRLLAPLPYRDVLAVKGVSYFLNAINYSAGTGAIAYFVTKRTDRTFLHALSCLLWLNFVDIIALLVMLLIGTALGGHLLPESIGAQLPAVLAVGWLIVVGAILYWRAGIDWLVLGRMRTWRIFRTFADAKLADYAVMVGVRMAFIMLYVGMHYFLLPTFDIHVHLDALLVYTPILTFVQIVPASVSGLGAITAVSMALYAPHVAAGISDTEAQVLAMSTVLGPATTLVRVLLGYGFISNVAKDFVPSAEAIAEARAAEDPTSSDPADADAAP